MLPPVPHTPFFIHELRWSSMALLHEVHYFIVSCHPPIILRYTPSLNISSSPNGSYFPSFASNHTVLLPNLLDPRHRPISIYHNSPRHPIYRLQKIPLRIIQLLLKNVPSHKPPSPTTPMPMHRQHTPRLDRIQHPLTLIHIRIPQIQPAPELVERQLPQTRRLLRTLRLII